MNLVYSSGDECTFSPFGPADPLGPISPVSPLSPSFPGNPGGPEDPWMEQTRNNYIRTTQLVFNIQLLLWVQLILEVLDVPVSNN